MSETSSLETELVVTYSDRLRSSASSKGNQIKWKTNNGLWLKADDLGYEGLTESIACKCLESSNIVNYAKYGCCAIVEEDTEREFIGCKSHDFLAEGNELITLYRLFESEGIDLYRSLDKLSTEEKLEFVINNVSRITGISDFNIWFGKLLEFDAFILNEDRHFHNIAVIRNKHKNSYSCMPVFDNGAGLLSDVKLEYPMYIPLNKAMRLVKAKPLSTDFNKQLKAVISVCGQNLRLSLININFEQFKKFYTDAIVNRVENIIRIQSSKYDYLFNENNNIKSKISRSNSF